MSEQTVWTWQKPRRSTKRGGPKLVAIAVVEPQTEKHQLVVRGPAGLLIEGVTPEELVALWRRLG